MVRALHLWSSPAGLTVQRQFDARFEAQYPGIQISFDNMAFSNDTTSKLLALAAADSLPDIVRAHPDYEVRFATANVWADLNPFVARTSGFNLKGDFLPVSLQYHQRAGKLNAIPVSSSTHVLYYNKDHFDKAGLAYPTDKWTYTGQFFEALQKLTQSSGPSRSIGWSGQMPGMDVTSDPVFLHPWGGAFLNDAKTACQLDQPATRDALTWWLDLKNKYQFTPQPADKISGDAFVGGRAALCYKLPQLLSALQQAHVGFNWDVAQLPSGPATRSTGIGADAYGMTSSSKHPSEAWTYLNDYTSTAGQAFAFGATGFNLPGRLSARPAFLGRAGNPAHVQAFVEAGAYAITLRPFGPEGPDVISTAAPTWKDALTGKRDVATVTAQICQAVDGLLHQASP
jgi:multiple sugar transport system substrate-binding protein